MKNVLLIIILLWSLLSTDAFGQTITKIGDQQQKKREKKWLTPPEKPSETVTAAWAPVTVQHHVGIRGGYGLGMVRFEPQRNTMTDIGLLNFGFSYRFDVPAQKYVGCIELDLEYLEKGYKYETYNESGVISSRRYSTIMLPILWQPYLPLSKGGSRFYLNAGPFVSYALESTHKTYYKESGEVITEGKYDYDPLRDNRWEYGITAGAGLVFAVKRFSFGIDARYNIALSDTFKGVTKYPGNPFRSPVDQINISFGINYRFQSKKSKEQQQQIQTVKK